MFQIRLEYEEAQKRVQAVQESLRVYMLRKGAAAVPAAGGSGAGEATMGLGSVDQGLIPQLGESFLDRLVEMSTTNSDVEYRQELTDRVIAESFTMAALEREQGFYEEIGSVLRDLGPSSGDAGRGGSVLSIKSRLEKAFDGVVAVVDQMHAIYEELSAHNLNPATLLYTVTTPFTIRTERALRLRTLGLYGVLVLMLSLFVVPLGCLLHNYVQCEIVHQHTEGENGGAKIDHSAAV